MSFKTKLAMHKGVLIASTAAVVLLTAYVIPFDSLFGMASAAKGGNPDNDNPNRYKVCEKKELTGKGNLPPKCERYGITG
jgi:hypothetical protein